MTIELGAAQAAQFAVQGTAGSAGGLQAGYGVSLGDVSGFQQALHGATARLEARRVGAPSEAVQQMFKPFEHINGEAASLARDARASSAGGRDMSPGEVVMLTVRCQEFMFHCQLTANIANRTSDGLQQLFRQQA